jgi:hypothetical protein
VFVQTRSTFSRPVGRQHRRHGQFWILRRSDLEVIGEFGRGGRQAGQFLRPHGMSVDSQGNLYVGEASTGRRVQKFALQRAAAK